MLPHLRELNISFEVKGFKPDETVTDVLFGRTDVTASLGSYGIKPVTNTLLVGSNSLLDTRPLFLSSTDAASNWRRLSHLPSGNDNKQLGGWSIRSGLLAYPANSSSYVSLTSLDTFDNFDVTVRVRGPNDNDWAGVVIAAVTIGNKTHTLSALRATRDGAESWMLVRNFRQADAHVYTHGTSYANQHNAVDGNGTWPQSPDGTTIRIKRKGSVIEAWASKFGSRNIEIGSRYTLNLADTVFVVPGAWGFGAYSQSSTFEIVSQANNGNQA